MRKWITLAGLALLLVSLGLGDEWKEKRVVVPLAQDGVQRQTVSGGSYYFDPNVIVVKVNAPVELIVSKAPGATPHNIVLKAPEAGVDFSVTLSTKPQSIKFTPRKTGKYEFNCTQRFLFFKSHKDQGMYGFLEVVD